MRPRPIGPAVAATVAVAAGAIAAAAGADRLFRGRARSPRSDWSFTANCRDVVAMLASTSVVPAVVGMTSCTAWRRRA